MLADVIDRLGFETKIRWVLWEGVAYRLNTREGSNSSSRGSVSQRSPRPSKLDPPRVVGIPDALARVAKLLASLLGDVGFAALAIACCPQVVHGRGCIAGQIAGQIALTWPTLTRRDTQESAIQLAELSLPRTPEGIVAFMTSHPVLPGVLLIDPLIGELVPSCIEHRNADQLLAVSACLGIFSGPN
jgi:hypothetical protein